MAPRRKLLVGALLLTSASSEASCFNRKGLFNYSLIGSVICQKTYRPIRPSRDYFTASADPAARPALAFFHLHQRGIPTSVLLYQCPYLTTSRGVLSILFHRHSSKRLKPLGFLARFFINTLNRVSK